MKHIRVMRRLRPVFTLGLVIGLSFAVTKVVQGRVRSTDSPATKRQRPVPVTKNQKYFRRRDSRHMHMKNWMEVETGVPGVQPLDPTTIPKYVNQLSVPPIHVPVGHDASNNARYEVTAKAVRLQMLPPGFPKTKVYAYGGRTRPAASGNAPEVETNPTNETFSMPGPTFEVTRGQPISVHYRNQLEGNHIFPVDPTLGVANPNNMPKPEPPFKPYPPGYQQAQRPIPMVVHLHGGITPSASDGFPEAWFTKDELKKGPAFTSSTFTYPNANLATTLWYHDHVIGMTRLNVAAGLAGTYIVRDPRDPIAPLLPSGRFEIPLMIQDRAFNDDGSIHFAQNGVNPDIHPYWEPEYFGDTIQVNGKVWPNLKVERRQYRFRIVNASNARFYNLKMSNGMSVTQIGADGGYLPKPASLTEVLVAPAERADILVDFSHVAAGTKIILLNTANQPFPDGDPFDPETTGQVMRFEVQNTPSVTPSPLPATLIEIPTLVETEGIGNPKLFTLNEQMSDIDEPVAVLIDGQHFDGEITEVPKVGTTEAWYFQNLSEDAHPVHIHLVEFQLEDRQEIDVERFKAHWESLNGSTLPLDHPTVKANVEDAVFDPATGTTHDFLIGPSEPPSPQERGWKDTFIAPPGKVTRVVIRFAPQYTKQADLVPGFNPFPFDASSGPGYVWHCHILDHEDNDMMRPLTMTYAGTAINRNSGKCVDARSSGTGNGTVVQQFTCNNTNAQKWIMTPTSGGFVRVGNANAPGQVWDVVGGSTATGARVQLFADHGGNNQQWQAVAEGGGFFHLVARHSGKCLDVPGSSTADGRQLQQFPCNGTAAQSFQVE
jgi:spore coat protein A